MSYDDESKVAKAARLCYFPSSISDLEEEMTEERCATLIKKLKQMKHGSPFEHVYYTFGIEGISRACLAQITRHRIASFNVQSQRYVGLFKLNKKEFDQHFFDEINTKEKAYFLGWLVSDGNIYIKEDSGHYICSIKLKKEDEYILYRFKDLLGIKNKIYSYERDGKSKLQFGNKHMINILKNKYGIIPNKSLTISGKKLFENIPEKYYKWFILGLFEGDGTVFKSKRSDSDVGIGIYSFSEDLLNLLKEKIPIFSDRNIKNNRLIFQGKNQTYKFLKYLYKDLDIKNDIFLLRKYTKALAISEDFKNEELDKLLSDKFIFPPKILKDKELISEYYFTCKKAEETYFKLIMEGILKEDARMVLPNAMKTNLIVTINARSLENFFNIRMKPDAQWEIRELATKMYELVKEVHPNIWSEEIESTDRGDSGFGSSGK